MAMKVLTNSSTEVEDTEHDVIAHKNGINHNMIILARESRGKSQSELAKDSGIDQGNLSKMEKGIHLISEDNITNIANALSFPVSFFYQNSFVSRLSDFFYRKKVTMKVKEKNKLEAEIDILRIVFDKFTESVDIPDVSIPNIMSQEGMTPEIIAGLTREKLKVKKGPVKNLISLLEKNGISVIMLSDVPEKFDGITVYTEKNHPLIIINKNMPNDRKRFTIAHELAHQVMHLPFKYKSKIYEGLKVGMDIFDKEADRFASEFLMPSSDIFNDLQDLRFKDLGLLKLYWSVSKKALIYRAKTLKCIDENKFKFFLIELSRQGERIKESTEVEIDESKVIKQLFEVHRKNFSYSTEDLSKILHISERDILKLEQDHSPQKLKIVL
jgi:Zn-dependent peptidase ImmA (M78 family)